VIIACAKLTRRPKGIQLSFMEDLS